MSGHIKLKRIYEPAEESDGLRILVDRIWPRGISKETAHLAEWLKEIGPSSELRKWFHAEPERFAEFREKYLMELQEPTRRPLLEHIAELAAGRTVTLCFAYKDLENNQAVIIKDVLTSSKKK